MIPYEHVLRALLVEALYIALETGENGSIQPERYHQWAEERTSRVLKRFRQAPDRAYKGTEELFREEKNRGNRGALPERR